MKKKSLKKLSLNPKIISNLSEEGMNNLKGGWEFTDYCTQGGGQYTGALCCTWTASGTTCVGCSTEVCSNTIYMQTCECL